MVAHGDIIDQQVDDLRERMRLLQQDRRANVDILEAGKASNAEEVRLYREENKDLRVRLSQLKKGSGSSQGSKQELSSLKKEILRLRNDFDTLKVLSNKHKKNLNKLKDEVKLCELEARRPSQEDSPLSRQIRMLENRLDKAMIKYNEAQSIRHTYEHILKRLKDERVSFDNQLSALERTLQSKQRDHEELLLLSGDASHAREVAQQELQRSRLIYEEKRSRRESEIRERHQVVKVRKQLVERQERREAKRKELVAKENYETNVDIPRENGTRGSGGTLGQGEDIEDMESEQEEEESRLDIYENAFRKIKEATGVSDVNEVITKIIGQESTTENLLSLTKQNQGRIEELLSDTEQLKKSVEDKKYSGISSGQSRKLVDEKEEKLSNSLSRLVRCKSKFERFSSILISVTAGVRHLQNKIDIVREEVGGGKVSFSEKAVVNVLKASGDVLIEVLSRIRLKRNRAETTTERDSYDHHRITNDLDVFDALDTLSEDEVQESRPFNQRVLLPSVRGDYFDNKSNMDDGFDELDEEEISRDRVKKNSSQIVHAQERKKTRASSRA